MDVLLELIAPIHFFPPSRTGAEASWHRLGGLGVFQGRRLHAASHGGRCGSADLSGSLEFVKEVVETSVFM